MLNTDDMVSHINGKGALEDTLKDIDNYISNQNPTDSVEGNIIAYFTTIYPTLFSKRTSYKLKNAQLKNLYAKLFLLFKTANQRGDILIINIYSSCLIPVGEKMWFKISSKEYRDFKGLRRKLK